MALRGEACDRGTGCRMAIGLWTVGQLRHLQDVQVERLDRSYVNVAASGEAHDEDRLLPSPASV